MDTSKSAKRVAKVAKQSAKTKVRTQRGLLFPVSMTAVILLGALLVVYARQGTKVSASVPPTLNDHWHVAYGIYACNEWKPAVQTQNELVNGVSLGIHTHGDGIIHIHPFASSVAGKNAKLGVFFKATGVKASSDKIEFPEGIGSYQNVNDKCDGKDATWKLAYWADANQSSAPTIYVTDFANVHFTQDRGAITLAFVPNDVDVATLKPQSIPTLDKLNDVGSTTTTVDPNAPTTTVDPNAPSTTAGATTTVASATTVASPSTTSG